MGAQADRQRKPENDAPDRFVETASSLFKRRSGSGAAGPVVQAKLEVGPVDDQYEREADAVADAVIRQFARSGPGAESSSEGGDGTARIARSANPGPLVVTDDQRDGRVARTPISRIARSAAAGPEGGALDESTESRIRRSAGSGAALDPQTRGKFESAMGADLSSVRVHTNSELAPEIGAHAFTHGSDVHFAPGTYDPGSTSGQHLIAHELAHVVQQTGAAQRVQAKLWTADEFKTKTAIKSRMIGPSDASTAQDVILALLAEYEKASAKGKMSAPTKISKVKTLKDVAQRWIDVRGAAYADTSNLNLATLNQAKETYRQANPDERMQGIGPAPDPATEVQGEDRKLERMKGLQEFVRLCDEEMKIIARDGGLGESRIDLIALDESSSEYKKAKKKYPSEPTPTSVFAKVGQLAEMIVSSPGSSAELEIEASVPVQPGVSVTFGLTGAAERTTDNLVKLRIDVKVGVEGGLPGAAELSGSLGGYLEAQAWSGAEAATLMSYALYRRGREGSAPTGLVNLLWGGSTDKAGMAKSEAWSRDLEKKVFGDEDPVEANGTNLDKDKRNQQRAKGDIYVETGATGNLTAKLGVGGAVEGELTGGAFTGRRVDAQSLMERKGGAGAQNVKSDSIFNAGERQKRVGQETVGWNFGGSVSAGGFEAGFEVSRTGRQLGGGAKGGESRIEWEPVELVASGKGPMPPALDLGTQIYKLAEAMVRKSREAVKKGGDSDDAGVAAGEAMLKGLAKKALFNPNMELPAGASLTVTITFSGRDNWSIGIGTEKANELEIPAALKVELTRSQLFLEIGMEDGSPKAWYLGK